MFLRDILEKLLKGELSVEDAERLIRLWAIEEIKNVVRYDLGRILRRDVPEVILAEGKSPSLVLEIVRRVLKNPLSQLVFISRVSDDHVNMLRELEKEGYIVRISKPARMVVVKKKNQVRKMPCKVGLITAGTADISVAEEARVFLEECGCEVVCLYDVGIAGLQRVIEAVKKLKEEDVDIVIVVAGREGALPSLISSLIDAPVIGVPTSIGYGAGGQGQAALLSMLQSCPLGLTVVNIDNGLGAAVFAYLVCKRIAYKKGKIKPH